MQKRTDNGCKFCPYDLQCFHSHAENCYNEYFWHLLLITAWNQPHLIKNITGYNNTQIECVEERIMQPVIGTIIFHEYLGVKIYMLVPKLWKGKHITFTNIMQLNNWYK